MKTNNRYTVFDQETGNAVGEYARKDAAIKAGEKNGTPFQVQSPSGQVVYATEVQTKPEPTGKGTTVAYTQGAKVFWKAMGAAAAAHAETQGLTATVNPDHTVVLHGGTAAERKAVAKEIRTMWIVAYTAFKEWKREHRAERKGFRDTSEGRKAMLLKEWALLEQFAKDAVS